MPQLEPLNIEIPNEPVSYPESALPAQAAASIESENTKKISEGFYSKTKNNFQSFWNKDAVNKGIVIGSTIAAAASLTLAATRLKR